MATLLLWLGQSGCNSQAPTKECDDAADAASATRPPLQVPAAASAQGSCVKRVTDHIGHNNPVTVHVGPRHQALNADETVVLLRSGHVMRLDNSEFVGQMPAADSLWLWSPRVASRAYACLGAAVIRYDFVTRQQDVVVDLSSIYQGLLPDTQVSDLASDGRLVVVAQRSSVAGGGKAILQINVEDGSLISTTNVLADDVSRHLSPRWVQALPGTPGFLVAWPWTGTQRQAGLELFDANGAFVTQVDPEGAAGDVAVDPDGSQWFVHTAEEVGAPGTYAVVKTPLTDGTGRPVRGPSQPLVRLDLSLQGQITCLARRQAFCVVATSSTDPALAHDGEIFRLDLESRASSPRVQSLLKHHSAPLGVYRHSVEACPLSPAVVGPHPSLDRYGRHVLFSSNWGDHCFAELYMLRLP